MGAKLSASFGWNLNNNPGLHKQVLESLTNEGGNSNKGSNGKESATKQWA